MEAEATTTRADGGGAQAEALRDAALVREFLAGDEAAFTAIVRRHQPRVAAIVAGCLRNRADVEEVVNDTFLRAYRGLAGFRGEASLATWLGCIAVNLARNRHWFLFRRRHLATSLDAPVAAESHVTMADLVAAEEPDPGRQLSEREWVRTIRGCLGRLPPRQREILELRGVLDRTYAEIAATLALNVGTVKSRIARARRHLRRELHRATLERRLRRPG